MKRLYSIDALRGFDMLLIMGFSGVLMGICGLFPNGSESWLFQQMEHAEWNGFHIMDTVFPTFLFVAGLSWPFSYANKVSKGVSRKKIYLKILERFVILTIFSFFVNGLGSTWDLKNLRYCGVLARIGFCWAVSAVLYMNFSRKTREIIAASILVGYYLLLRFVPVPGAEGLDPFSLEGNLVGWIDRCITPGSLYLGTFDPEGLLSNLPAIVTAMLGVLTGEMLRDQSHSDKSRCLRMFATAAGMLVVGLVWSRWFPVNKNLWSSTFVLVAGAYALALFCLFYLIIDVLGFKKWAFPFKVIGMNSITIYMAIRMIGADQPVHFLFGGALKMCSEPLSSLVYSICYTLICWVFLYFLYKKNIFLKV